MSDAPGAAAARPPAIGPGRLVLVVGPSGAGKDTLIGLARTSLADDPGVVFARRVITREASPSEDNEEVTAAAFDEAAARNDYAMRWDAHGHRYAVRRVIDDQLRQGITVVANVSRTVIAAARSTYASVSVILITAPPDVLAQRLAMRARASDRGIAERLEREVDEVAAPPDLTIVNVGNVADHGRQFVRIIKGEPWSGL